MPPFDEDTLMALKALEQSLAAGRMKLDEMRPAQEFLPAIMAAIRDESGLTMIDLRRLAEGPGIPSRVIMNALRAVQHQAPRESPEQSVAWDQFRQEIENVVRQDADKVAKAAKLWRKRASLAARKVWG